MRGAGRGGRGSAAPERIHSKRPRQQRQHGRQWECLWCAYKSNVVYFTSSREPPPPPSSSSAAAPESQREERASLSQGIWYSGTFKVFDESLFYSDERLLQLSRRMETATMAPHLETSPPVGKGVSEGDVATANAVDVEGVATQLQAVTIDGTTGEKDAAAGGRGVGSAAAAGVSSTTTSTIGGPHGALGGRSDAPAAAEKAPEDEENEFLALLTEQQRAAVASLSQLQQQHDRLEHQYETELIALKMKYEALYDPLYVQRKECLLQKDPTNPAADDKGTPAIPRFWLECLKRNSTIADLIEEHDEPILEYLQNISCEYFTPEEQRKMEQEHQQQQHAAGADDASSADAAAALNEGKKKTCETDYPESFRLIFDFAPNPYFTPTRLVKAYHLTTVGAAEAAGGGAAAAADAGTAADEGPAGAELTSTRSTEIRWEAGKDVTKKVVTRKQRNKKTRQTRVVQEVVDNESFFNFFTDHDIPTDEKLEAMTDKQVGELQMVVEADYDIGVVIRDRIIPQAVKWFLGEADDDEQMDDDLDEDDEDADSDELSDSEEEDDRPSSRGRGKVGWGARGKGSQDW